MSNRYGDYCSYSLFYLFFAPNKEEEEEEKRKYIKKN